MNKITHKIIITFYFLFGITFLTAIIILGHDYFTTSIEKRYFHDLHKLLKPSGVLGHALGIIGSLMMITGVLIYSVRKRVKKFMRVGLLKHWLELHIFLCTVGPLMILFHTTFKFGGIVSVSFWSMTAVVLSGVIGRFIFAQIPKSIQGNELSFEELKSKDVELNDFLRNKLSVDEQIIAAINGYSYSQKKEQGISGSVVSLFSSYFRNSKFISEIKKSLAESNVDKNSIKEITRVINDKLVLQRKINMLSQMQKLFNYWHVAHFPFAIVMFLIMALHVGVAIAFGYNWIF